MSVPVQFKGPSTKTFGGYMSEMMNYKDALLLGLVVMILAGILTSIKKDIIICIAYEEKTIISPNIVSLSIIPAF